jgi:hypothetical protein
MAGAACLGLTAPWQDRRGRTPVGALVAGMAGRVAAFDIVLLIVRPGNPICLPAPRGAARPAALAVASPRWRRPPPRARRPARLVPWSPVPAATAIAALGTAGTYLRRSMDDLRRGRMADRHAGHRGRAAPGRRGRDRPRRRDPDAGERPRPPLAAAPRSRRWSRTTSRPGVVDRERLVAPLELRPARRHGTARVRGNGRTRGGPAPAAGRTDVVGALVDAARSTTSGGSRRSADRPRRRSTTPITEHAVGSTSRPRRGRRRRSVLGEAVDQASTTPRSSPRGLRGARRRADRSGRRRDRSPTGPACRRRSARRSSRSSPGGGRPASRTTRERPRSVHPRSIARELGGDVVLASAATGGTILRIRIPREG